MNKYLFLLALLIAGCETAPTRTYDSVLQSYIGRTTETLIMNFGAPTQEYKRDDKQYLTFFKDGGSVLMPIGGMAANVRRYCKTTFMINEIGLVSSYSWEGNMCQ